MIRVSILIAIIGGIVVATFKYKALTNRNLATLVYDLNLNLVKLMTAVAESKDPNIRAAVRRATECGTKAQKIINRARLEGIL